MYGDVPPVALNAWLYAVPAVPCGRGDAVSILGFEAADAPCSAILWNSPAKPK